MRSLTSCVSLLVKAAQETKGITTRDCAYYGWLTRRDSYETDKTGKPGPEILLAATLSAMMTLARHETCPGLFGIVAGIRVTTGTFHYSDISSSGR